ncbi:hypothetical protein OC844_003547 [Tilletia horrida]|nr:hypothetical protein OC844_003547 [Tilletia horrida]
MEDSSDSSLNPWGLSFGLRRSPSGSNGGGSATGAGSTAATMMKEGGAGGGSSTGTLSRAAAKKHPLASSPNSQRPGSPALSDAGKSQDGKEHELTPETSVVVHPVAPTDTFSSIALRYGTDVNAILRANRLWQGDAPQMRAEIFIPLLNCKRTPPDTILRSKAAIASSGGPSGSRSPAGAASASSSSVLSSREGPGAESLPSATASTATAGGVIVPLAPGFTKPTVHAHRTASSAGGSGSGSRPDRSSREGDRDWKPNKWTLGSSSTSSATGSRSSASVTGSASETTSNTASSSSHHHSDNRREQQLDEVLSGSKRGGEEVERASTGWNDAPAPNARIARAYQGGTRRAGHHRLLQDLAAGLPPNTGAAANWQRPINDSLPVPPNALAAQSGRVGALGPPPRSGNDSGGGGGGLRIQGLNQGSSRPPAGLGKILSDAFRGRLSVEDAFEAAIQSVSASVTTPPSDSTPAWASYRGPDGRGALNGPAGLRAASPQPGFGTGPDGVRPRLGRAGTSGEYETVSPFGSMRGSSHANNGLPPGGQPSPPGHELERLSFEESSIRAEKWEREQARLGLQGKGAGAGAVSDRLHPSAAAASSTGLGRGNSSGGGQSGSAAGGAGGGRTSQAGLRSRGSVRNFDWAENGSESSGRTAR